jgi:hypothetical protein
MCLGGGSKKQAAYQAYNDQLKADKQEAEMRAQEELRQSNIKKGQQNIEGNFAQYNDPYYQNYEQNQVGYYKPQLEDQFKRARDTLTASLADRGILESSVGADQLAQLQKRHDDQATQIASQAHDASNTLRGNVERAKTNLYAVNTAAADPNSVSARAQGEAGALAAPQSFTPMANMFADLMQPLASFATAKMNSLPAGYKSNAGGGSVPTTGAGTSRVVS